MLKINVETIPYSCMRYPTVGDWTFEPDGTLNVNVSSMSDPVGVSDYGRGDNSDSEFLIAIHEIIEAYLCKKAGITAEVVDDFDMNYAKQPEFDLRTECKEPGDDQRAPYHVQHLTAQSIEMMLCAQLGLSWGQHCENVEGVK